MGSRLHKSWFRHCRGEDDVLIELAVSFQRSMYCVTSAVI
ncbi:MAG TPA: CO2 hydration protein [Thermosynechococcaceae cyanobacterium]